MKFLQERLGLTTKDEDFSAVWLTRDQLGLSFLTFACDLSKIDAKILGFLVHTSVKTSKSPFSFLDKHVPSA